MTPPPTASSSLAEIEIDGLTLSDRSFWALPFERREREYFARLRAERPVSYHRPYESTLVPPDEDTPGFWALTRYDDIRSVSRNPELFCSGQGILMEDFPEVVQVAAQSFLCMDAPRHTELRGLVQKVFSPRRMQTMSDWIAGKASTLVDAMIEKGEGDFCEDFAKLLPGHIFADFFGVPEQGSYRADIIDAAERMLAWDDPDAARGRDAIETHAEEAQRIHDITYELIDERRRQPGDDLMTWLVEAEFEGERMDEWEIAAFMSLLGSAANDTTRHSLAHGAHLLTTHPEQRALLLEDLEGRIDGAVEEILRFASPVMQFRRTATADTEIRGVEIAAGEKVVIWYCSGNYDDDVFERPHEFDILRDANKHLSFGGGGPHYCLGNALGRQMLKAGLTEIYTRMPDLETANPRYQINNFIHGVAALDATWTPGGRP